MQKIRGRGNIQVAGDINQTTTGKVDYAGIIIRLQGIQISLLVITIILSVITIVKYQQLEYQLEEVRDISNRAATIFGERYSRD